MIRNLSIVIIGRNEGERLIRCLESVRTVRAKEGEVEIIYVDSDSTDGSPEVAASFGAKVVILHGGKRTAARGRNAGWQQAVAPYVLFLDGDTILHPDFPQAACKILEANPGVAAVWGHRRELHPERSVFNRVLDLDWIYPPGALDYCGGDVLMRRSALAEVDGYDAELIAGEEPELCRRLRARGYRILHIDAPMTGHDLNMTKLSQYWWHAIRAGYAYAELSNRYRNSADPMWLLESRRNVRRGVFWMAWLALIIVTVAFSPLWTPLLLALGATFVSRSAWKARYKAPSQRVLLLLFGVHSHFQQIPILFGQLKFLRDRLSGRPQTQIEYKAEAKA
jgi:glycosyltransferase involved in cell wall biosynthesis